MLEYFASVSLLILLAQRPKRTDQDKNATSKHYRMKPHPNPTISRCPVCSSVAPPLSQPSSQSIGAGCTRSFKVSNQNSFDPFLKAIFNPISHLGNGRDLYFTPPLRVIAQIRRCCFLSSPYLFSLSRFDRF